MLETLRIENLAVVEEAALSFTGGLNVITGTTGAGKSLVVGAINLLLGEKASAEVIRAGADSASVEAVFTGVNRSGDAALAFGSSDHVTLRRTVNRNGRGRASIDGTTVTLRELRDVSRRLIEPHGQNEQFRLRDPDNHAAYLDAFASCAKERARFEETLDEFRAAQRAVDSHDARVAFLREKRELLEHRVGDVDRIAPVTGEKESLERRLGVLENAEKLFASVQATIAALDDDDASAATTAAMAARTLGTVARLDDALNAVHEELDGAVVTLRECASELRRFLDRVDLDPSELRDAQERMDTIIAAERRYAMSFDALAAAREEWRGELEQLVFADDQRDTLSATLEQSREALTGAGTALGDKRRAAAAKLDRLMTRELDGLMMKGATFRCDIQHLPSADGAVTIDGKTIAVFDDGLDVIRMRVRTNPGEAEGGVETIASTGEVSRIALALKEATSAGRTGTVLIFDEIDSGVGADLGGLLGEKLLALSDRYQIVCISHMPQIAARAHHHQIVEKRNEGDRTRVEVRTVAGDQRRSEIARMLGGATGSDNRMALAAEMLAVGTQSTRP